MKGTVKFYNKEKRWGFIKVDGDVDHFFHRSQVQEEGDLEEGDIVEFNSIENKRGSGSQAENIVLEVK